MFLPRVIENTKNYYGFEPVGIILPAVNNSRSCFSKQVVALSDSNNEVMIWTENCSSVHIFIGQGYIPEYELMKAVKLYIKNLIFNLFSEDQEFGIYLELKRKMDYPVDWKRENFDYWVKRSQELNLVLK